MANFTNNPLLTNRFSHAIAFVLLHHKFQVRKDGSPYVAHLLSVAALILENGGTENEAIAGVLHDSVEDVGVRLPDIKELFGEEVALIIWSVTEHNKAETWKGRKLDYINQIREGSDSAVLVSLADKYHNGCSYLKGARLGTVDDSQSNPERTLWFYDELMKVYQSRLPECYLVSALSKVVEELKLLWGIGSVSLSQIN